MTEVHPKTIAKNIIWATVVVYSLFGIISFVIQYLVT